MNKILEKSVLVNKLFTSFEKELKDSVLFGWLKIENPKLGFFLAFGGVLIVWYEGFLGRFFPQGLLNLAPLVMLFMALFVSLKKIKIYSLHLWYLGFLFLGMISGVFSTLRGDGGINLILYIVLLAEFILAFMVGQAQKPSSLLKSLIAIGLPAALVGIWQFWSGKASFSTSALESVTGRSSAFFTSPNVFGMLMAILVIVSIFLIKSESRKVLYITASLVFAAALFTSLSRTSWLAALLGIIPLFEFKLSQAKAMAGFFGALTSRITVLFNPEFWYNASVDGRIWSINNGLYILKKFPVLGTGPGTYGGKFAVQYTSPAYFYGMQNGYPALLTTDNQFIGILVQFGIVGFLAFLGFWLSVFAQILKNNTKFARLGLSVLVSFILMMAFANTLEFTAISVPAAFILGASLSREEI